VYRTLYLLGNRLPKREKLGIHKEIENILLEILKDSIEAALISRDKKSSVLQQMRRNTEVVKHLVRLEHEMKIITEKEYTNVVRGLEDVSMMANGWLKSITQKPAQI
jgi:hypothetical protein